ncbi:hypothetical protein KFK09_018740 [Dendrobium nobile]|uniref:Uncharacterized protein n=1 Tax=Dendrobium nobile TaxID=94219 RepID=A0A8T3AV76_DENNO|nr:hypothetical protein KFK09_018740 [Dendrobium nobile]
MADMNSATPILASHCSSAIKWRQKWRSVGAKRERQTSVCRSVGDALSSWIRRANLWDLAEKARERKKDDYLCNEQAPVIVVTSDPTENGEEL